MSGWGSKGFRIEVEDDGSDEHPVGIYSVERTTGDHEEQIWIEYGDIPQLIKDLQEILDKR